MVTRVIERAILTAAHDGRQGEDCHRCRVARAVLDFDFAHPFNLGPPAMKERGSRALPFLLAPDSSGESFLLLLRSFPRGGLL
jgi:hypothetical protein